MVRCTQLCAVRRGSRALQLGLNFLISNGRPSHCPERPQNHPHLEGVWSTGTVSEMKHTWPPTAIPPSPTSIKRHGSHGGVPRSVSKPKPMENRGQKTHWGNALTLTYAQQLSHHVKATGLVTQFCLGQTVVGPIIKVTQLAPSCVGITQHQTPTSTAPRTLLPPSYASSPINPYRYQSTPPSYSQRSGDVRPNCRFHRIHIQGLLPSGNISQNPTHVLIPASRPHLAQLRQHLVQPPPPNSQPPAVLQTGSPVRT